MIFNNWTTIAHIVDNNYMFQNESQGGFGLDWSGLDTPMTVMTTREPAVLKIKFS